MRKGKHRGREMKEGEAGRGEHGVRGGRECWREGRRREGGREIRARQAGGAGGDEGGMTGEGDTNAQCQAWLCTEACQWLLAFTLY